MRSTVRTCYLAMKNKYNILIYNMKMSDEIRLLDALSSVINQYHYIHIKPKQYENPLHIFHRANIDRCIVTTNSLESCQLLISRKKMFIVRCLA